MPETEEVGDEELLISGLQHFSFCRRQWALIHIEGEWSDNYYTVDGGILHERADDPYATEKRGDTIISRAMEVRSSRYGIRGKCDVVEFHKSDDGVPLRDSHGGKREGLWLPIPIEYKRGTSKENDADRLQLCAQALCLEEMFACPPITTAYLFYEQPRRREMVMLDEELREKTQKCLSEMRMLRKRMYTPRVKTSAKCKSCSMRNICLPKLQKYQSASAYTDKIWEME